MKLRRFTAAAITMVLLNSTGFTLRSSAEQGTISLGDLNADGYVDAVDASIVLSAYANISTEQEHGLTPEQEKAADVNYDSFIDAVDASKILSYYAYVSTGGTVDFWTYLYGDFSQKTTTTTIITTTVTTTTLPQTTTAPPDGRWPYGTVLDYLPEGDQHWGSFTVGVNSEGKVTGLVSLWDVDYDIIVEHFEKVGWPTTPGGHRYYFCMGDQ